MESTPHPEYEDLQWIKYISDHLAAHHLHIHLHVHVYLKSVPIYVIVHVFTRLSFHYQYIGAKIERANTVCSTVTNMVCTCTCIYSITNTVGT